MQRNTNRLYCWTDASCSGGIPVSWVRCAALLCNENPVLVHNWSISPSLLQIPPGKLREGNCRHATKLGHFVQLVRGLCESWDLQETIEAVAISRWWLCSIYHISPSTMKPIYQQVARKLQPFACRYEDLYQFFNKDMSTTVFGPTMGKNSRHLLFIQVRIPSYKT